jgi:hypothetical protein
LVKKDGFDFRTCGQVESVDYRKEKLGPTTIIGTKGELFAASHDILAYFDSEAQIKNCCEISEAFKAEHSFLLVDPIHKVVATSMCSPRCQLARHFREHLH